MISTLHIDDNNLMLSTADGWVRTQGYAWLKDGEVYFDLSSNNNAALNCRLEPQQINSRYWQQCNQTALAENESGMRNSADLIWQHLKTINQTYEPSELLLVTPSHYREQNLSLLLGVAKEAGLNIASLVNKAVYSLAEHKIDSNSALHIDVQLHQTVCSEVVVDAGRIALGKVEILHEVGIHSMQDALLRAIQDRFISSDRFDPLHYAVTEQQLFDQLNSVARQIDSHGKADVRVEYQGREHNCSIDVKQWNMALKKFADALVMIESNIADRYYDTNGFAGLSTCQLNATQVSIESIQAPARDALLGSDESGPVVYRSELDTDQHQRVEQKFNDKVEAAKAVENTASVGAPPGLNGATHLLQDGKAIPIEKSQIVLSNNQFILNFHDPGNVQELLHKGDIFVINDDSRKTLSRNDRLGSDLVDGVITVVEVQT